MIYCDIKSQCSIVRWVMCWLPHAILKEWSQNNDTSQYVDVDCFTLNMMPVNALASLLEAFLFFSYRQTRRHCCTPAAHACGVVSNSGICPTISTQKLWGAIGGTGLHLLTLDCFLPPISVLCTRGEHTLLVCIIYATLLIVTSLLPGSCRVHLLYWHLN